MDTAADRLAILTGLGGQSIEGPDGSFTGLFERDYVAVGEAPAVDDTAPRLWADTATLKDCGVVNEVTLRIDGDEYLVRSVQPDGTGMTMLVLEAV